MASSKLYNGKPPSTTKPQLHPQADKRNQNQTEEAKAH